MAEPKPSTAVIVNPDLQRSGSQPVTPPVSTPFAATQTPDFFGGFPNTSVPIISDPNLRRSGSQPIAPPGTTPYAATQTPGFFDGFPSKPVLVNPDLKRSEGPGFFDGTDPNKKKRYKTTPKKQTVETVEPGPSAKVGDVQASGVDSHKLVAPREVTINEWRTRLVEAAWRGVRFEIKEWSLPIGRRAFVHEYPQRNTPFVEDSGIVTRTHKITAYILGDDYDLRRNALILALEEEGDGELDHPYLGKRTCRAMECSVTESVDEQRISRFDLTFTDVDVQESLVVTEDTVAKARKQADATKAATLSTFVGLEDILNGLAGAALVIQGYNDFKASVERGLALVLGASIDLLDPPETLGDFLSSFIDIGRLLAAAAYVPVLPPNLSRQERETAEGLSSWVKTELFSRATDLVTSTEYDTRDDATLAAESVLDAIRVEERATNDPGLYDNLIDWRVWLGQAMLDLGALLPRLRRITLDRVVPAHVVAYGLYDTPYRDAEIVKRNNIPHPSFMTGPIRVVAL